VEGIVAHASTQPLEAPTFQLTSTYGDAASERSAKRAVGMLEERPAKLPRTDAQQQPTAADGNLGNALTVSDRWFAGASKQQCICFEVGW
jgi:hypothetical protein